MKDLAKWDNNGGLYQGYGTRRESSGSKEGRNSATDIGDLMTKITPISLDLYIKCCRNECLMLETARGDTAYSMLASASLKLRQSERESLLKVSLDAVQVRKQDIQTFISCQVNFSSSQAIPWFADRLCKPVL